MLVKKEKEVVAKEEVIVSCQCNKCGVEILGQDDLPVGIEVKIGCGYGSWWDGENHIFHLCNDCYRAITDQFSIPVDVENYL